MKARSLGLAAAMCVLPAVLMAQGRSIEVKNEAFQEIEVLNENGTKELRRVPAEKVLPGTEVIYVTTVRNLGKEPAERVVVDNPMPEHMLYRGASVLDESGTVEVSVDGGKRYGLLAALEVDDGLGKARPAEADDVTHVRFKMNRPLRAGGSNRFGFRAVLR
jgi:uncharacterized repeat protein (TIGR01451 family)